MSTRPLNLTISQASAVRSAFTAIAFEKAEIHIDFDPIDVHLTDAGWLTVRGGPHGFEEHKGLASFEAAYGLLIPDPDLLALACEMEAICETHLLHAEEEGRDLATSHWAARRDRCRSAISAALARSKPPAHPLP